MKNIYFLIACIFLPAGNCFSQATASPVFHLDSIPPEGVVLKKGWKFHAGDDLSWAKPGFNDAEWKPIDPTSLLHKLPEVRDNGSGWFRLHLHVDSSLRNETIFMSISFLGAAEIYLNGQRLYSFGKVSADYNKEETHFLFEQPYSMKLGGEEFQTLAIRYSFNKKNLYLNYGTPLLKLDLHTINQGFKDYKTGQGFLAILSTIQLVFFVPLGLLLLFLYFSFPTKKEYLFLGFYCFCMFIGMVFESFAQQPSFTVSHANSFLLAEHAINTAGVFSFLMGINILYKQPKNWFYYLIVLCALLNIPALFISYDYGFAVTLFFYLAVSIEVLRLSHKAMRRHKLGSVILFTTSLFNIIAIISIIVMLGPDNFKLFLLLRIFLYIIPALGLSLFVAVDFAHTGSALQQRLAEIEKLSNKTIEQEKERQRILTAQNETLERQVTERTAELSQSLKELKETQAHLIQREKMASLGELTAGIAHEIQNPLNFINNFSDVNNELIEEMKNEFNAGKKDLAFSIADDIKENGKKINLHGKRADAIVKGMLQHSGTNTGEKQPTDINALADECLRLSYQGVRAKDKTLNVTLKIQLDNTIGPVSIVPQDIGRVLLNLCNNAFYSVAEKKRNSAPAAEEETNPSALYEAVVTVTTSMIPPSAGKAAIVSISVKDNGMGIPQKVLGKIYQPFFTTKPTGQGTGLGLSLSYDIIKAHGGELEVETVEGKGAEFMIELPYG